MDPDPRGASVSAGGTHDSRTDGPTRRRAPGPPASDRDSGRRRSLRGWGLLAALVTAGCRHEPQIDLSGAAKPPAVQVIRPPVRDITRVVGQPSFIEAYERTSIYPKPT